MVNCAICKKREAQQRHHLSYDPEIVIDVCVPCHVLVHEHGVGLGKGEEPVDVVEHEEIPVLPIHTKMIEKDEIKYIVTKDEEEILTMLRCINGCSSGWQFLRSKNTSQLYFRCSYCGWDLKLERVG